MYQVLPKLATEINTLMGADSASYMYWTDGRTGSTADLDPGMLNDLQMEVSAFHWALHKFAYNNYNKPLLHLDIHGKGTRTGARENQMDVSNIPMKYYFDTSDNTAVSDPILAEMKTGLNAIYANDASYTVKPNVADDPEYTGLRGDKTIRTMSMQAGEMGIPTLFIHLPYNVRKQIRDDTAVAKKWAEVIVKIYNDYVKAKWSSLVK